MIFEQADATGIEADARLTAMWLWTLSIGAASATSSDDTATGGDDTEEAADDKDAVGGDQHFWRLAQALSAR